MNALRRPRFERCSAMATGACMGEAAGLRFRRGHVAADLVDMADRQKIAAVELGDGAAQVPVDIASSTDVVDDAWARVADLGGLPIIVSIQAPRRWSRTAA